MNLEDSLTDSTTNHYASPSVEPDRKSSQEDDRLPQVANDGQPTLPEHKGRRNRPPLRKILMDALSAMNISEDNNLCTLATGSQMQRLTPSESLSAGEYVRRVRIVDGRPVSDLEMRGGLWRDSKLSEERRTGTNIEGNDQEDVEDPYLPCFDPNRFWWNDNVYYQTDLDQVMPDSFYILGRCRKSEFDLQRNIKRYAASVPEFLKDSKRPTHPACLANRRPSWVWLPFHTTSDLGNVEDVQKFVDDRFLRGEMFHTESEQSCFEWRQLLQPEFGQARKFGHDTLASSFIYQAIGAIDKMACVVPDQRVIGSPYEQYAAPDPFDELVRKRSGAIPETADQKSRTFPPGFFRERMCPTSDDEDYGSDNRRGRLIKLPEFEFRVFAKVIEGVDPDEAYVQVTDQLCVTTTVTSDETVESSPTVPQASEIAAGVVENNEEPYLRGGTALPRSRHSPDWDDLYDVSDDETVQPRLSSSTKVEDKTEDVGWDQIQKTLGQAVIAKGEANALFDAVRSDIRSMETSSLHEQDAKKAEEVLAFLEGYNELRYLVPSLREGSFDYLKMLSETVQYIEQLKESNGEVKKSIGDIDSSRPKDAEVQTTYVSDNQTADAFCGCSTPGASENGPVHQQHEVGIPDTHQSDEIEPEIGSWLEHIPDPVLESLSLPYRPKIAHSRTTTAPETSNGEPKRVRRDPGDEKCGL